MKRTYTFIICAFLSLCFVACKSSKQIGSESMAEIVLEDTKQDKPIGGDRKFVPRAQLYRTNGDYIQNVTIQVSTDGKTLLSYPDPADVKTNATPLQLANGFLLDRRGISADTRFTRYTFAEYSSLSAPPSSQELISAIIQEAIITELVVLPMTTQEAVADTATVNALIYAGLPGCRFIIQEPATK